MYNLKMHLSTSEAFAFSLIRRVLVFSLVWATIIYGITINRWYLGGFLILVPAIVQLCTIIYCFFKSPRYRLHSYILFPVAFFSYVAIRHIISKDILTQGVSDLFLFAFTTLCLISFSKEEYIDFFKCFCQTMAYISIISTVPSLLTLFIPQNIMSYTFLPELVRLNLSRFYTPPGQRLVGIQVNPNSTAWLATYGFVFCVALTIIEPQKKKHIILLGFSFLASIVILFLTESRATMLFLATVLLGCIIAWICSWKHSFNKRINTLIVIILGLLAISLLTVIMLFFVSEDFRATILGLIRVPYEKGDNFVEISNSFITAFMDASSRNEIRDKSLEAWISNPVFGVSLDTMTADYPLHIDSSPGAHNSFIQILANTGLVGFTLFILMLGTSTYFLILSCLKEKEIKLKTLAQFSLITLIAILCNCYYENLLFTRTTVISYCAYFILLSGFQFKSLFSN